jgi:hypothetical protein
MEARESSPTRCVAASPAAIADWRTRLRVAAYDLYRGLAQRPVFPLREEMEGLVDLIDEGRAEVASPPTLTRATAEALGGAISQELAMAAARRRPPRPEGELVPTLLYMAVLPYMGANAAAEELRAPPPRR